MGATVAGEHDEAIGEDGFHALGVAVDVAEGWLVDDGVPGVAELGVVDVLVAKDVEVDVSVFLLFGFPYVQLAFKLASQVGEEVVKGFLLDVLVGVYLRSGQGEGDECELVLYGFNVLGTFLDVDFIGNGFGFYTMGVQLLLAGNVEHEVDHLTKAILGMLGNFSEFVSVVFEVVKGLSLGCGYDPLFGFFEKGYRVGLQ